MASRFKRAKMSKHSRGDQKTIKVGQVCRDQIKNVSYKLWMQMSTNSHLSLQVTIAVIYPLNITTRTTHVVTSSITLGGVPHSYFWNWNDLLQDSPWHCFPWCPSKQTQLPSNLSQTPFFVPLELQLQTVMIWYTYPFLEYEAIVHFMHNKLSTAAVTTQIWQSSI